ncbi:hypothetical protein BX616_010463 [Lobosporangium transversale]|nr:hypothetical protein BX616_010463 [Lobosporangium transversale]
MDKKDLARAMQYKHPTRPLDIETINGNLNRILTDKPQLRSKIKTCLQQAVRCASKTKRTSRRAIGQYIEQLSVGTQLKIELRNHYKGAVLLFDPNISNSNGFECIRIENEPWSTV